MLRRRVRRNDGLRGVVDVAEGVSALGVSAALRVGVEDRAAERHGCARIARMSVSASPLNSATLRLVAQPMHGGQCRSRLQAVGGPRG